MKRNLSISIAIMFLATASFAAAQIGAAPATDVLGAHLNYGRGCPACHAPHSGALGNGKTPHAGTETGSYALWGEDASPLYGATISFGATKYAETLPSGIASGSSEVTGILMCLSCHDGNIAKGAMMRNAVYEILPSTYGGTAPPTLIGNNGVSGAGAASYLTDHPVGTNATISCGAPYNWDCSISATGAIQPGPNMTRFINNYGFFVKPGVNAANQPMVLCTTCHNQHLMNVVSVTNKPFTYSTGTVATSGTQTGLPSGSYATMFFILAPYNPADSNPYTNQTAQFCRQCHGGEANESNGGTAGTVF